LCDRGRQKNVARGIGWDKGFHLSTTPTGEDLLPAEAPPAPSEVKQKSRKRIINGTDYVPKCVLAETRYKLVEGQGRGGGT